MQLQNASKMKLFGSFGMKVFDVRSGRPELIFRWVRKNQVTNQGRTALLELMCPFGITDASINNQIWSFEVGTNNTPPSIDDDETTMTAVFTSNLSFSSGECVIVATSPNSYYLAISKSVGTGDANGSTLTEAGIYTRGDDPDPLLATGRRLYARQVHSPIIKTGTMTIVYDWQLGILIQS